MEVGREKRKKEKERTSDNSNEKNARDGSGNATKSDEDNEWRIRSKQVRGRIQMIGGIRRMAESRVEERVALEGKLKSS